MTSVSGVCSLTWRRIVSPSPSGSLKSSRIRSTPSLAFDIASAAVPASRTLYPSLDRRSRSDHLRSDSSSTTSIVAAGTASVYKEVQISVSTESQPHGDESASRNQLEDFKRALDHAATVAITVVLGRITYVNDTFCRSSGYSCEELVGQDHRIVNSNYHSKDFIRDLWRTIASGHVWHGELRNRAKDGHIYWVDTTIVPFLNARGKPYQYIAIRSDITARKEAEEKLAQQAALARVGQMAAVVAHEVRNPLAGIKGAVQVLMSRRGPGDTELPVMRDIVGRIDSLSELINDLMLYARPRPPRFSHVELRPLVSDAVTFVRRDPAGQSIEITVAGEDVSASVDTEMIRATVLNLVLNAAQAMAGRGKITLTLGRAGDVATLEVRDN